MSYNFLRDVTHVLIIRRWRSHVKLIIPISITRRAEQDVKLDPIHYYLVWNTDWSCGLRLSCFRCVLFICACGRARDLCKSCIMFSVHCSALFLCITFFVHCSAHFFYAEVSSCLIFRTMFPPTCSCAQRECDIVQLVGLPSLKEEEEEEEEEEVCESFCAY